MNNKGFFITLFALVSVFVLLAFFATSNSFVNSSILKVNKISAFETRHAVENLHYLMDKSSSQALKDSLNPNSCKIIPPNVRDNLSVLFDQLTFGVNNSFEVLCSNNILYYDFDFPNGLLDVKARVFCSKTIDYDGSASFVVNMEKTFDINKSFASSKTGGICSIDSITDIQGNYVEYP